jgi:hypothetical protein
VSERESEREGERERGREAERKILTHKNIERRWARERETE